MVKELNYEKLKKSLGFLVDRYIPWKFLDPEVHPVHVLERFENKRMAMARRGLIVAIADMVEGTQDFSSAQVREADAELKKIGAYTLTFLRSQLRRRRSK